MPTGSDARRTSNADLKSFIKQAYLKVGIPENDADRAAELMAEADRIGADGHGVFRLPQYIQRIKAGGMNINPDIRIEKERTAMAVLNGDNAMGHLVMHRATEIAMDKAFSTGVAWVGVHHSNHAGPAALYAKMPVERDMIGLYCAIGNANHLPPWGGTEMLLSTNPIAVGVPALKEPSIVLDMATTVAAYGKVKQKILSGEEMPEGWMIDRQGEPITDPKRADEGFLLPIGGPKGYGLGLIIGILAGTLNGAAFGRDVIDFNADDKTTTNTGQFILALDIAAFMDVQDFKRNVDTIWKTMKSSPKLPGFDEIRLPGERSDRVARERSENGIPLHPALRVKLDNLAGELEIAPLN